MHTRASNFELVEPLPKPERTMNRRLHRRNRRVSFEQNPINDEPMWVADHVVAPTLISAITIPETANEFAIKGDLKSMESIEDFVSFREMITSQLQGKLWLYDEVRDLKSRGSIEDFVSFGEMITSQLQGKPWLYDEVHTRLSDSFPPALFDRLLGEIQDFSQHENESLTDAWLRMKEMLINYHAGGIFLYKTPNQVYQLLEDKVLLKLDWAKNQKTKSSFKKSVAFAAEGSSNSDTNKIMARMDVMTMKMDAQYKDFQSRSKQSNLDDDDIPMSHEEEAKFMQTFR
ncbi:hypothetical protein Tco_0385636, partial [Tanacetum coccineum]